MGPGGAAYYWHRFYRHQPDLNFDNPEVRKAMMRVVDYWLGMGVDGMRLDAVPYLFEREGTNCENLPETHAFLKELRAARRREFPEPDAAGRSEPVARRRGQLLRQRGRMPHGVPLPADAAVVHRRAMEDRFPIVDILQQTPAIPDVCQWVLFLRNHDELTLEMVTEEERDYMYRDLRPRPAGADQPGHSPPAGAADGQ